MDVRQLCEAIQLRVTADLHQAQDPALRSDILIDALYDVSRLVLPELGYPKKSAAYLEGQGAVLDLITFLAIPLIRTGAQERRGVAVLSEIAEGCLDPLLKKKFSVYAQELLARSRRRHTPSGSEISRTVAPWLLACVGVAALAIYLSWPNAEQAGTPGGLNALPAAQMAPVPAAAPEKPVRAPVGRTAPATTAPDPAPSPATAPGAAREGSGEPAGKAERAPAEEGVNAAPKPAGPQGELAMRVRIVNNQVLVPVTLKNGAGSVQIELLLDTGATRTAIHESVAGRLPIDLSAAKSSQAVVADGRVIRSRVARIDAVIVGPFAMTAPEVELIPYQGEGTTHDGLLGMDFLSRHRYHIDMEQQLIRWF